jgi:restriction system protein
MAAWTVRTGRHGERDSWALENGLCGGGWVAIPDLTPVDSREGMAAVVTQAFGESEKAGALPNYTGQLWALRSRIQPGDLMVLPLKTTSQIAFGRVTSGYEYLASESDASRRHVVRVDWQRTDVPRTAIKQDLLFILGSALTVFEPTRNDAAWRLEKVMETGVDPGARTTGPAVAAVDADVTTGAETLTTGQQLEDFAATRIQTLIQENFAGHDLARLVEAVLTADGFVCERKPPGADGGVDVLAGRGPLGLDSPRVVVQVKSESTPVGDPVVQTLQGAITRFAADQALLVAWGGVNRNAEKFLETTKFQIRVWDASDLIKAIYRVYPNLPADIRSELPLKQIWIPVDEEVI